MIGAHTQHVYDRFCWLSICFLSLLNLTLSRTAWTQTYTIAFLSYSCLSAWMKLASSQLVGHQIWSDNAGRSCWPEENVRVCRSSPRPPLLWAFLVTHSSGSLRKFRRNSQHTRNLIAWVAVDLYILYSCVYMYMGAFNQIITIIMLKKKKQVSIKMMIIGMTYYDDYAWHWWNKILIQSSCVHMGGQWKSPLNASHRTFPPRLSSIKMSFRDADPSETRKSMQATRFQVSGRNAGDRSSSDDDEGQDLLDGQMESNQDTKMYKSFRHFTREALPRLDNYRNILSIQAQNRPTLDELHNATLSQKVSTFV